MLLSVFITYAANAGIVAQRVFHRQRRRITQPRYHVAVDVERDRHARVPEQLGDYLRVDALRQEQRRARVPEVVEAYVRQPGPPQELASRGGRDSR